MAGAGELHSDVGATAPSVGAGRGATLHLPPPLVTLKSPCRVLKKSRVGSKTPTRPLTLWLCEIWTTRSPLAHDPPNVRGRRTLLQAGYGQLRVVPPQPTRVQSAARAPSGCGLR